MAVYACVCACVMISEFSIVFGWGPIHALNLNMAINCWNNKLFKKVSLTSNDLDVAVLQQYGFVLLYASHFLL